MKTIDIPKKLEGNSSIRYSVIPFIISIILASIFFFTSTIIASIYTAQNYLPSNPSFSVQNTEITTYEKIPWTKKVKDNKYYKQEREQYPSTKFSNQEKLNLQDKLVTLGNKLNMQFAGIVVSNTICDLNIISKSECEQKVEKFNNDYLETKTGEKETYRITQAVVYTIALTQSGQFKMITSTGKSKAINDFFSKSVKEEITKYPKQYIDSKDIDFTYQYFNLMLDETLNKLRGFGQVNLSLIFYIYLFTVICILVFFTITRRKYSLKSAKWFVQDMNQVYGDFIQEPKVSLIDTKVTKKYIPPVSSGGASGGGGFSAGGGSGGGGGGSSSGGSW